MLCRPVLLNELNCGRRPGGGACHGDSNRGVDSVALRSSSLLTTIGLENIMNASQPSITGIAAVGIPVTDQDRALGFYTEALGMEKRLDVPLPQFGGRWITVAPSGSKTTLALIPAHDGVPAGVETGIRPHQPRRRRDTPALGCTRRGCRRAAALGGRTADVRLSRSRRQRAGDNPGRQSIMKSAGGHRRS